MVSPQRFVEDADIQWQKLGRALVGASFGAIFMGWASIVLAAADLVIRPLEWLASFWGNLVELAAGTPARLVDAAWLGAVGFVREGGPLAFVFAVAIVLLTLYAAVRIGRLA